MTNIINKTEQRQVMLGRLAAGLVRSNIYPTLQEAYKAARLILLDAETITSITKLNTVTAQIRRAVTEIDAEGWSEVTKELEQVAIYDAAYYAGLVGTAASVKLSTPPDEKIIGYINKSMMSLTQGQKVDAGTWAQFTKAFASSHTDTLDSIVRNGYAQGQTVAQMAAQMRQVTDGLLKVQAETLARTGVQHYAVNAREAMFLDNDVDEVVYNATLDNMTTSLCAGRDGKRWKMTDPKRPALPAHYSCRSVYIPAIAMQDVDTRAAVGGQKGKEAAELFEEKQDRTDKKVKYKGRKDSEIFKAGQVQYTTYDRWLEKQPRWFVESALGKERAELFLSGKVSISQFNDLSGRPLTLAQLRALDGG
jgi:SPP1 gp7 family putative phage head morphogenesis protein